jgi:hypothetical protein
MIKLLHDTNFYILLSSSSLLLFLFWRFKGVAAFFLKNHADSIAKSLNQAKTERGRALAELTRVTQKINNLPEEIRLLEENYSVDDAVLERELAGELAKIEFLANQRLETMRNVKLRTEFSALIGRLCAQFRCDILNCSESEKERLLEQSIQLLGRCAEEESRKG